MAQQDSNAQPKGSYDDEKFAQLLQEWNLSQYASKMKKHGWDDADYWTHLDETTLKTELGFQSGHVVKFLNKVEQRQIAQSPNSHEPITIKLVTLGDTKVGKSSIIVRFCKNEFDQYREPTIGATFLTQTVSVWNFNIRYEIWDTAGQEKFRSLAPLYYRGASAALIVYDITNRESFENATKWIQEVHSQEGKHVIIALAGNKVDLHSNRVVTKYEALELAKKNRYIFFETSAKHSINIKEIFHHIGMLCILYVLYYNYIIVFIL